MNAAKGSPARVARSASVRTPTGATTTLDAQNRVERGCTVQRCGRHADYRLGAWGTQMIGVELYRCERHVQRAHGALLEAGYRTILTESIDA
jgi:hypothetical protein